MTMAAEAEEVVLPVAVTVSLNTSNAVTERLLVPTVPLPLSETSSSPACRDWPPMTVFCWTSSRP